MKKPIVVVVSLLFSTPVFAQSLTDQIAAASAAEDRQNAIGREALAAQQQQEQNQQKQIDDKRQGEAREVRREQKVIRAQAAAVFKVRAGQAAEEAKAKASDAAADKRRDQAYEDKLRDVELQEKLAALQADKTRAARANDFIDRELAQKSAETDVIKSQADATRNVTSGVKTLLERTGEAEVKNGWESSTKIKSQPAAFEASGRGSGRTKQEPPSLVGDR